MALKYGTEDLIQKLQGALKNELRLNSPVSDLRELEGNVILSVPATELAAWTLIASALQNLDATIIRS